MAAGTNKTRSIIEIFGHSPTDYSSVARKYWSLNACPFIGQACTKYDHTKTICYGVCAVSGKNDAIVICPNRLYADNYETIRKVSHDAFGDVEFMLFQDYIQKKDDIHQCVVALGQNSGREVKIQNMSMDWVLAHIIDGALVEYIGIEVQSIDITGNYRDAWYAARDKKNIIPASGHGLNWANVHKRLIPQLIRKGLMYSRSSFVKKGIYFILPEEVYLRFEDILGNDIPTCTDATANTITVHTYILSPEESNGQMRHLIQNRVLRFDLSELSNRFISGPNLPAAGILDAKIKELLAVC